MQRRDPVQRGLPYGKVYGVHRAVLSKRTAELVEGAGKVGGGLAESGGGQAGGDRGWAVCKGRVLVLLLGGLLVLLCEGLDGLQVPDQGKSAKGGLCGAGLRGQRIGCCRSWRKLRQRLDTCRTVRLLSCGAGAREGAWACVCLTHVLAVPSEGFKCALCTRVHGSAV